MPRIVQPGADMSDLFKLSQLTKLVVGGDAITDSTADYVLSELFRLRELRIQHSNFLSDVGVLSLTSLDRLTMLRVLHCDGISHRVTAAESWGIQSQVGAYPFRHAGTTSGRVFLYLRRRQLYVVQTLYSHSTLLLCMWRRYCSWW